MTAKLEVEIVKSALSECLHTISDARIERGESSDDEDEKVIDWDDETIGVKDEVTCSTNCWADFDFDDTLSERSRTNFDTKIEKVDNSDENDMLVKSNVDVEVVNLTAW